MYNQQKRKGSIDSLRIKANDMLGTKTLKQLVHEKMEEARSTTEEWPQAQVTSDGMAGRKSLRFKAPPLF